MGLLLGMAVLSSFCLTPVAVRLAWKHDAVSRPDGLRKKHGRPTPEWGGLAVSASVLLGMGLSYLLLPAQPAATPFLAALAFSVVILCVLGCYDDLFDMRASVKLVGQLLAVVPLIAVGAYVERFTVFGFSIELGWFGVPCTIAWIVLGINALNLIDGMDGLAPTVGIMAAAAVAVIAGVTGNTHVAVIAVVLAGALAGFLVYNLPPARIYLGDSGSMVIGLVLATLALRVTAGTGSPNLTAMCALLFVPLYDTLLAVVRRGLNGKSIMAADRGHIHHRLLDRGLGVWNSLALLAALSLTAGCVSCFVILTGQELVACAALGVAALLFARFELFGHQEWAMVKDRFTWPWRRDKAAGYASPRDNRPARGFAMHMANETGTRAQPLDGFPQTRTSLFTEIGVGLGGAEDVGAAAAGNRNTWNYSVERFPKKGGWQSERCQAFSDASPSVGVRWPVGPPQPDGDYPGDGGQDP